MAIDFERECFFIAPIGKEGSAIRRRSDGVRELIVKGAANSHDLETRRADDVDEPGQITGQIIQHCLKARMCVADLTGGNPNVYYELSVRDGAQLPVVLIAEVDTDLPFDVSQSRVIFFDHGDFASGVRAREEVRDQIGVALERLEEGVPADNPISNGMRLAKLHDPAGSDQWQALLFDRLERLSRMTSDIDSRLRQSERGEEICREVRRNQLAHGQAIDKPGVAPWFFYFDENLRRKAAEEGVELRKEAEEAGLSPGAYMDDEIIEADETKESKESEQGS
jgi:hypothetical protein